MSKPVSLLLLGGGFATDAYDLFIINAVMVMLKDIMSESDQDKSIISTTALVGAMVGQIVFGVLGDAIGRWIMFILSVSLILLGSLASSVIPLDPWGMSFFVGLGMCRTIIGLGIGGEYPLSSALGHETHSAGGPSSSDIEFGLNPVIKEETKAHRLSKIFFFQGVGTVSAVLVGYGAYCLLSETVAWRFCLGIATVPCAILFYFRWMHLRNNGQHAEDKTLSVVWSDVCWQLRTVASHRTFTRRLLGTTVTWFLLDVVFYANGLFSGTILNSFTNKNTEATLRYNIYLGLIAAVGYVVAIGLIDRVGRYTLQLVGFLLMALVYLLAGIFQGSMMNNLPLFLCLYGLTFLFSNAGPNTTTYILAAESFPKPIRTTTAGFSAAAGKLGAAIGAAAMAPLATNSLSSVFYICCGICIVGSVVTYFCVDDLRQTDVDAEHRACVCEQCTRDRTRDGPRATLIK